MGITDLLIIGLVTYRLSHMITIEDGPFDIFVKLRMKIDPMQTTWVGRGLQCILCVSFWLSFVATALHIWLPLISMSLAGAGFVLLVKGVVHK